MNLIVAVDRNFAIGRGQSLLCHLPEDLRRFKELTMKKTVVMGYHTLLSLPHSKPLPNRENIVLTSKQIQIEGAKVVHSVEEALALCDENSFIMGGSSIYRQFLPYCRYAYITHIHESFEADVFFPPLGAEWKLVEESAMKEHKGILFSFALYQNTLLSS